MSQTPPSTLTCPVGHTFPYEQLTTRNGLAVCPVCDGMQWETSRTKRPWSRAALGHPLLLLLGASVMFLVEMISGIGIGVTYQSDHVGGAGWLVAGSSVAVVGIVVLAVGVIRVITALRSASWSRAALSTPLIVVAVGLGLMTVGDLLELGLNIAFIDASGSGAGWQLVAQIFDTLYFGALAGVVAWVAVLTKRPDSAAATATATASTTPAIEPPAVGPPVGA
jgi:hypothetical protein